jgi:class 3 adenylate cyclase
MEAPEMNVDAWLQGLGLGQYSPLFRDHAIDSDILPDLTDGDLEKISIPLGHRKRILKAVLRLQQGTGSGALPDLAEWRQLTVLFCDLVGSTALSTRLDPEDLSNLIRTYQNAVFAAVAPYDGHVTRFMGDGALVLFGYPRAHEDDAERAVRAALRIMELVHEIGGECGISLELRSGIASGLVVVGEVMGFGDARERGVIGDTPNLAARLQALAQPGTVLIAETTRRLLGATFELDPVGPQLFKGFDQPIKTWLVVRRKDFVSRFEAASLDSITPFVGREKELTLLLDCWSRACDGRGELVLLSGEAGSGKSRLLTMLQERIGSSHHGTMRHQCSPHHANEAFHPIISQIWYTAGFVPGEPPAARLDKLEAMVARSGLAVGDIAPFLASLLSLPTDDRYPLPNLQPSEMKERTTAVLVALFAGITRRAPVLLVWEDAHWIDPTSLEVLGRVIKELPGLPALVVITFRPEFEPPWPGSHNVSALSLKRLGRDDVLALVERVTGGRKLPADVADQIASKTDGVPLFVEELTKTILESGVVRAEGDGYVRTSALMPLAIPSTLQGSLMARLDRLATSREVAQVASAIGREFSIRLLEAVSPVKGSTLEFALDQLVASDLVQRRVRAAEVTFVFKHALVQDTAYASLLRSRRQRIHAEIAQALIVGVANHVESGLAMVAHHYTEAGLTEPAVRHWLAAAEAALARSDTLEGARYADRGLELVPKLQVTETRSQLELGIQVARGNAAMALKGYTAQESVAIFTAIKHILDTGIGTDQQRFSVLYGLWVAKYVGGRIAPAQELAAEYLGLARRHGEATYVMIGERLVGAAYIAAGCFHEGLASLKEAYTRYDPVLHRPLSYRFGQDIGLSTLCHEAWAHWCLGRIGEAAQLSDHILGELKHHGHANTVAFCTLYGAAFPALFARDFERAASLGESLARYCNEHRMGPHYVIAGRLCQAVGRGIPQPTREIVDEIQGGLQALHGIGIHVIDAPILAGLAEIALGLGNVAFAATVLQGAITSAEELGDRYWSAEYYRLSARVALAGAVPDPALAAERLWHAIAIARQQGAVTLQLRATLDLVEHHGHSGDLALIEPLLAVMEGGESAPDVRRGRALLARVPA